MSNHRPFDDLHGLIIKIHVDFPLLPTPRSTLAVDEAEVKRFGAEAGARECQARSGRTPQRRCLMTYTWR
jgi:hypothetical protein